MAEEKDLRSTFEIEQCDLMGRRGSFKVNGRKVRTPELMPVVNPNKIDIPGAVTPRELKDRFRFNMIITNSYIINRGEDLKERAIEEGLHRMLSFDGVIMTDSGTFQSYMYGGGKKEVNVDPLEIVRFQIEMGADVGTILDKFTVPGSSWEEARSDLDVTLERAKASLSLQGKMEVAVPIQGGRHTDLRMESGKEVADMGAGYAPIGGVVPIMESYDYPLLVDVIANSKEGLGPSIPVHLFGAGHPMLLPLATALGCDLFDSASYIKFAQDNRYMTRDRTYHLGEMDVFPCSCPVCSTKDPSDIMSMPPQDRTQMIARHNLWVLRTVLDDVRSSIEEGTLWELVERSAMSNPSLFAAVKRVGKYRDLLEENSPRSTRRFLCCSGLSLARPEFTRYQRQMEGMESEQRTKTLLLKDWTRSHNRNVTEYMCRRPSGWSMMIDTPLGPVPYEILDMYPVGQSIFPPPGGLDMDLSDHMDRKRDLVDLGEVFEWDGSGKPDIQEERITMEASDIGKVLHLIRFQFGSKDGIDPAKIIFGDFNSEKELLGRLILTKSRNTGRIRNISIQDGNTRKHLLSIRAEDGMLTIKIEGAKKLQEGTRPPWRRVMVDKETGEFNSKGLNVFCKFVKDADPNIRAGDDVMVVDEDDHLLAVGRSQASRRHLIASRSGIAVKVRVGVLSKKDKDNN